MYNLYAGQGLGFAGAKLLAFGLGATSVRYTDIGGLGGEETQVKVVDNAYSKRDDNDIIDILTILFQVIE